MSEDADQLRRVAEKLFFEDDLATPQKRRSMDGRPLRPEFAAGNMKLRGEPDGQRSQGFAGGTAGGTTTAGTGAGAGTGAKYDSSFTTIFTSLRSASNQFLNFSSLIA